MASYKVEEVDGPTTYYDSSGRVFKIDEYGSSLVPYSNRSNSLVPATNQVGQLVPYSNKSNSVVPSTNQEGQLIPSSAQKRAAAVATALGIIGSIAAAPNPFSSSGKTIGETVVSGAKKAGKYVVDKTAEKIKNWWNKPKKENKKTEQKLIEGPKGGGAKKTTKEQTQIVPRTKNIQTKQVTELGTVSGQVKKDQIQQAAQRLIEQEKQEDPLYAYERESIRNIEAAQRRRVPWKLPPIDVGITRMTGFEPFSATPDQTFNIFYGSGSIDPFIRS